MATRGNDTKPRRPAHRGGVRFVFKIDAFTPSTIPMARLGEYMTALAQFLGEIDAVHFKKITPGSACLNVLAEREAAPKIRARAEAVRTNKAPRDVMDRYRAINKMLRDDKGAGRFGELKPRAKILAFPGQNEVLSKPLTVKQQGTFDGELMRVGGRTKPYTRCWFPRISDRANSRLIGRPPRNSEGICSSKCGCMVGERGSGTLMASGIS